MKEFVASRMAAMGYEIVNKSRLPADMEDDFHVIYKRCREYTSTSIERMYGMYKATEYIVRSDVKGAVVECGVWRGGSTMAAALTLQKLGVTDRWIYLYDTFSGMAEPSEKDISLDGSRAREIWSQSQSTSHNTWCYASLDEVRRNLLSTEYPVDRCVFVKGKVEDTIPETIPEKIALLRLDTDWFSSTYHELVHLFPRISPNGVLIIDDYGHWKGAREAVDEYIASRKLKLILHRLDYTGRIGIKSGEEP
jgi:O-methyltransferase